MILESDLPTFASLTQLDTIPGSDDGRPGLEQHMPLFRQLLRQGKHHIQFHCATATGKSKTVPSAAQNEKIGHLFFIFFHFLAKCTKYGQKKAKNVSFQK